MARETFNEWIDRTLEKKERKDATVTGPVEEKRAAPPVATLPNLPSVRAARLVTGDRQNSYGHPYPNHKRIAAFWNARLAEVLKRPLEPHEVAACMRLVKEARLMETPGHADSLDDIAGYADVEWLIHEWEGGDEG